MTILHLRTIGCRVVVGVCWVLLAASPATRAEPPTRDATTLGAIVVEPTDDFRDFAEWKAQLEPALANAQLKSRDALTERDRRQILVLAADMPKLRGAVAAMERVIADNPREVMLSPVERLALVRAYLRAQSILLDVPDELALRCRLAREPDRRNERAVCDFDFARARQFVAAASASRAKRDRRDPKKRFTN